MIWRRLWRGHPFPSHQNNDGTPRLGPIRTQEDCGTLTSASNSRPSILSGPKDNPEETVMGPPPQPNATMTEYANLQLREVNRNRRHPPQPRCPKKDTTNRPCLTNDWFSKEDRFMIGLDWDGLKVLVCSNPYKSYRTDIWPISKRQTGNDGERIKKPIFLVRNQPLKKNRHRELPNSNGGKVGSDSIYSFSLLGHLSDSTQSRLGLQRTTRRRKRRGKSLRHTNKIFIIYPTKTTWIFLLILFSYRWGRRTLTFKEKRKFRLSTLGNVI